MGSCNGTGQKLNNFQINPGFSRSDLSDRLRQAIQRAVFPKYAGRAGA